MENQIDYYLDTGKDRDNFDAALPEIMPHYTAFRKAAYKEGALNRKVKRLIALAVGFQAGCTRCIIGQTRDAVEAGATKEEVLEAVAIAVVMGGTAVSAETWRVVKVLKELGKW